MFRFSKIYKKKDIKNIKHFLTVIIWLCQPIKKKMKLQTNIDKKNHKNLVKIDKNFVILFAKSLKTTFQ